MKIPELTITADVIRGQNDEASLYMDFSNHNAANLGLIYSAAKIMREIRNNSFKYVDTAIGHIIDSAIQLKTGNTGFAVYWPIEWPVQVLLDSLNKIKELRDDIQ